MANLSIVIVPAKKLSNGRHRVRIAVAHRSQTRYISTQFILDSANQMKNGRVVKHENAANINACLRKLIMNTKRFFRLFIISRIFHALN